MSIFHPIEQYRPSEDGYALLPFRFTPLAGDDYVLTNIAGEYHVVGRKTMMQLLRHELISESDVYCELRARHFLTDSTSSLSPTLLSLKLRTRYDRLRWFTGLHMFVVTLRCEHACPYCQVSRQSEDRVKFDMSEAAATASIALALRSPSPQIKIEFQGGEPLLNFPLVQYIVQETERRNASLGKDLAFVIATNLALVTDDVLTFCKEHRILISTSLDGPKALHNANRPRPGGDSYERTIAGIVKAREVLGCERVSALMTTTESSLSQVREIIDEYRARDFPGIFLRPLSPYGFAMRTRSYQAYTLERWLSFYKAGLDYIIELNRAGFLFQEYYAATILKKMLTSNDPGYVDLMSPAGIGMAGVVYNYDGAVYASDEGRMLAEMGQHRFQLGHVLTNTYEDIFLSSALLDPLEESFSYSVPMCHDCAFEPFCGADPVYHYATSGDYVGRKPESDFCRRNMELFRDLILRMDGDPFVKRLFMKWANGQC